MNLRRYIERHSQKKAVRKASPLSGPVFSMNHATRDRVGRNSGYIFWGRIVVPKLVPEFLQNNKARFQQHGIPKEVFAENILGGPLGHHAV